MDPSEAEGAVSPKREPLLQLPVHNDNTTMNVVFEPSEVKDTAKNVQGPRGRKRSKDEASDDEEPDIQLLEDGKTPLFDTGSLTNNGSMLNAAALVTGTQLSSSATTNPSAVAPTSFWEASFYEVMADQVLWRWLRSKVRERGTPRSFGTPEVQAMMDAILQKSENNGNTQSDEKIKDIQSLDKHCMDSMTKHLWEGIKNRKTPSETATTAQLAENFQPNYNSAWLYRAENLNSDVIAVKLKSKEIQKQMSSKAANPPPSPEVDLRDPQFWMAKATKVKNDMAFVRTKLEDLNNQATDESGPQKRLSNKQEEIKSTEEMKAKRWADGGKKLDEQKARDTNIAKGYTTVDGEFVAPAELDNEQKASATNIPKFAKGTFVAPAELASEKKVKNSKIPKSVKESFIAPTKPIDEKSAIVNTIDGPSSEKAAAGETKDFPSSETLVVPSASTVIVPSLISASTSPEILYEKKGDDEKTTEIKYWVEKDETTSQEDISNITTAFEEHTLAESIPDLPTTPKQKYHEEDNFVEITLTPPPVQPTFDEEADWVKLDESVVREPHEGDVEVMELPPANNSEHNGTFRRWYRFFRR